MSGAFEHLNPDTPVRGICPEASSSAANSRILTWEHCGQEQTRYKHNSLATQPTRSPCTTWLGPPQLIYHCLCMRLVKTFRAEVSAAAVAEVTLPSVHCNSNCEYCSPSGYSGSCEAMCSRSCYKLWHTLFALVLGQTFHGVETPSTSQQNCLRCRRRRELTEAPRAFQPDNISSLIFMLTFCTSVHSMMLLMMLMMMMMMATTNISGEAGRRSRQRKNTMSCPHHQSGHQLQHGYRRALLPSLSSTASRPPTAIIILSTSISIILMLILILILLISMRRRSKTIDGAKMCKVSVFLGSWPAGH